MYNNVYLTVILINNYKMTLISDVFSKKNMGSEKTYCT